MLSFVELQPLRKEQVPEQESRQDSPAATPAIETPPPTIEPTTSTVDTSNWKIYRSEEYGFEVVFPSKLTVSDLNPQYYPRTLDGIKLTLSEFTQCSPPLEIAVAYFDLSEGATEQEWRREPIYNEHSPSYGEFTTFQGHPSYLAIPDQSYILDNGFGAYLHVYSEKTQNILMLSTVTFQDLDCRKKLLDVFKLVVHQLNILEEF